MYFYSCAYPVVLGPTAEPLSYGSQLLWTTARYIMTRTSDRLKMNAVHDIYCYELVPVTEASLS